MKLTKSSPVALLMVLGACAAAVETPESGADPGLLSEVPEGVRAIAAPYQDLTTVRIAPENGCYYYLWNGPVESTFLPLRTAQGNPICARAQEG